MVDEDYPLVEVMGQPTSRLLGSAKIEDDPGAVRRGLDAVIETGSALMCELTARELV